MLTRSLLICLMALFTATASLAETATVPPIRTPEAGTLERKEILDALRAEVKKQHGLDVIFVVVTMNVTDNWAWLHTRPQSEDGSSKYEDITALMNKTAAGWEVVELPCGEVSEISSCGDAPPFLENLMQGAPQASPAAAD